MVDNRIIEENCKMAGLNRKKGVNSLRNEGFTGSYRNYGLIGRNLSGSARELDSANTVEEERGPAIGATSL